MENQIRKYINHAIRGSYNNIMPKSIILKICILVMYTITLFSCETVIDTTLPDRDKKIVLNSLINPEGLFWVNLSKSTGILDSGPMNFIDNGKVKIYQSGNFIEELIITSNGNYYSLNHYPVSDKTYEILVDVSDMPSVSAECFIPPPIEIISSDTVSYIDNWGDKVIEGKIIFNDPVEESNYYWFTTTYTQINIQIDSIGNVITDNLGNPVLEKSEGTFWVDLSYRTGGIEDVSHYMKGIFFSDRIIDGKNFKLEFNLYPFWSGDYSIIWLNMYFELRSVTKDFYLYARSLGGHFDNGPFSEPSQVYNNIKNGFGIFAGYSTSRDSVLLIDQIGNL
ncbi:DUF4249 domain-containing protein [Bacteroidota bacterium]